jgi:hypothetical protein
MNSVESDEAFARRLQAQEMGIMLNITHNDAQTPLMVYTHVHIYVYACIWI